MANKVIKSVNLLPEIFRTDKNSKKYAAGDKERIEEFHAIP